MAKRKIKLIEWLTWVAMIFVSLGIGGLFVNGGFTMVWGLSIFPLLVHQIVGWFLVILTLIGLVFRLYQVFK